MMIPAACCYRPAQQLPWLAGAALVLVAFVALSFVGNREDERATKQKLVELGALVALDADGRHVGTVTLSTIDNVASVREALKIAAELDQVKALDLNRTGIDNSDLQTVGTMSSLTSLSLKSTAIDDAGLAQLAGLQRLEALHLNGTEVSEEGLSDLAALDSLKLLDLSKTHVVRGLAPIAELPHLEWLLLRELSLADDALAPLASAPSLKRLSLKESGFNASSIADLREQKPELAIDE
jgi:hypothetical protein